jgi:hypothetical protein
VAELTYLASFLGRVLDGLDRRPAQQ